MDEDNEPLVGTWVSHRQSPQNDEAVFVNMDGDYALEVPEDCQMLYFSYEWDFAAPLSDSDTVNVIHAWGYHWDNAPPKKSQRFSPRQFAVQVSGKVAAGKMSETAAVRIKGTDTVAQADGTGRFSLLVPPGSDVLVFAAENHFTREIRLGEMRTVYVPISLEFQDSQRPDYPKKRRWWQIFRRRN